MTIKLSSKGGGGGFAVNNIVYGTIPTGASGDILSVPAAEGAVIKLSFLCCQTGPETVITISCGSRVILQSGSLQDGAAIFSQIGNAMVVGPSLNSSSNVLDISTLQGESLTITKDTGTTASIIYYAYQIGV